MLIAKPSGFNFSLYRTDASTVIFAGILLTLIGHCYIVFVNKLNLLLTRNFHGCLAFLSDQTISQLIFTAFKAPKEFIMHKRQLIIVGIVLIVTTILFAITTFRQQAQKQTKLEKDKPIVIQEDILTHEQIEKLPIVDFPSSLLSSKNESQERKSKNVRDNKSYGKRIQENKNITHITEAESWIEALPVFPVSKSNIILIGTITDSHAYLSEDKANVHSEFDVKVDKVLYNKEATLIIPNQTATVKREGGRVRFASGHIQTYYMSGQGSPEVGATYIMFVNEMSLLGDNLLITAFKIVGNKVYSIDNISRASSYKGVSFEQFQTELEKTISTPQEQGGN